MNALRSPLHCEVILVRNRRLCRALKQVRLQRRAWLSLHHCKTLIPPAFIYRKYQDNMCIIFVGVRQFLGGPKGRRPYALFLRHLNAFGVLTFHNEKLCPLQVHRRFVNDLFPLGELHLVVAGLVGIVLAVLTEHAVMRLP